MSENDGKDQVEEFFHQDPDKRGSFCRAFAPSVFRCDNHEDILKLVDEARRLYSPDLKAPFIGNTLWQAVKTKRKDVISSFVEAGADINMWFRGEAVLHRAVKRDDWSMVKFLLSVPGMDKDAPDTHGTSPLVMAGCGRIYCLNVLLSAGCDPNACDKDGDPALHKIIEAEGFYFSQSVSKCLDLLLHLGVDINVQCTKGQTALHKAVERQLYEAVVWLLYRNADINAPVRMCSNSFLHLSCCVRVPYYTLGLDIEEKSNSLTPLFIATSIGNGPLIDVLIRCGCTFRKYACMLKECAPVPTTRQILNGHLAQPPSLKSMCRNVIRSKCGWHITMDAQTLGLPDALRRYVLCLGEIAAFRAAVETWGKMPA